MSAHSIVIEEFVAVEKNTLRGFARVRMPSGMVLHDVAIALHRRTITIEVTAAELYSLIYALEAKAAMAADVGLDDAADMMFLRVAELREAAR